MTQPEPGRPDTEPRSADREAVTVVARTVADPRCPNCAASVGDDDRFCEECGRELGVVRAALPPSEFTTEPCAGCAGERFDAHGYCADCGELRRAPDRCEAMLDGIALITDRGVSHARNEDAVAAAVLRDTTTLLAVSVCDGVSSTRDPQLASGAAARAGAEACLTDLMTGRTAAEAVLAGLDSAWKTVRGNAEADSDAASCTYVAAAVRGLESDEVEIAVASVGDSRAYWLDATGAHQIGSDDSFAQALVDGGMDETAAMRHPQAHALLRWLGADSDTRPWSDDCVHTLRTSGPGTLLLCSDGLWNYLPDAAALASRVGDGPAPVAARDLVDFALRCGGHDNITVALVPVPLFDRQE
ncbi:protein phosphatase 2C domain-containing protein [Nocardia sp. NPDC050406]|uniref:protein phosphatase 2C domain-containing protein n=1 Tax=Nocardia sp. NPDC050406 TaxID=3364318 RepID=UPI0037A5DBF5